MEYTSEIINISKIKEGFFVGDQIAGTTPEVIVQFKITHIINAAGSQINKSVRAHSNQVPNPKLE